MTAVQDVPVSEAETQPEAEEKPEVVIDLTEFEAAITRVLDDGASADSLRTLRGVYRDLNGANKRAARNSIETSIRDAVQTGQIATAQTLYNAMDALKKPLARTGASAGKRTDDQVFRVVSINVAYSLAYQNPINGAPKDWAQQVEQQTTQELVGEAQRYREWIEAGSPDGQEPEVSDVAKAGARISLGRGPKGQGRKPKSSAEILAS